MASFTQHLVNLLLASKNNWLKITKTKQCLKNVDIRL